MCSAYVRDGFDGMPAIQAATNGCPVLSWEYGGSRADSPDDGNGCIVSGNIHPDELSGARHAYRAPHDHSAIADSDSLCPADSHGSGLTSDGYGGAIPATRITHLDCCSSPHLGTYRGPDADGNIDAQW